MADGLVKVQVALGNIASKRERVKILYKKSKFLLGACLPSSFPCLYFLRTGLVLQPIRSLELPFGDRM